MDSEIKPPPNVLLAGINGSTAVLPDRPDQGAAEAWLQDVRRAYWDPA